jgi:hypothetical protein
MNDGIARRRLRNQLLTGPGLSRADKVVAWFGAMQGQEYEPAKWAVGQRMPDGTVAADVERALAAGRIVRTHAMRPTWHFVAAADLRWIQALTGQRVRRIVSAYDRRLGLEARTVVRGIGVIERTLRGGQSMTRPEIGEALKRSRLGLDRLQLSNLVMHAELEGVICSGPRRARLQTYALVEERVPPVAALTRDEALATLCRRYFTSHAPATIRDFCWWSGLTVAETRRGLEMNRARREDIDGLTYWSIGPDRRGRPRAEDDPLVHLLPIYDEYVIAYRDRKAVPHSPPDPSTGDSTPGREVTFQHALVIDGRIIGTWRTTRDVGTGRPAVIPLRRLTRSERLAVAASVRCYQEFAGR